MNYRFFLIFPQNQTFKPTNLVEKRIFKSILSRISECIENKNR